MDIQTLTSFFGWCSVINGCVFVFWALCFIFAPGLIYRMQTRWFPMQRETYDVVVYSFLGLVKVFFLFFNLVPYVALRIIA